MKTLFFVLTAIALPALASAQVDRATLTGVVRDPSNAAVAGDGHSHSPHHRHRVEHDHHRDGTYLVVNLPPGESSSKRKRPDSRSSRRRFTSRLATAPALTSPCPSVH